MVVLLGLEAWRKATKGHKRTFWKNENVLKCLASYFRWRSHKHIVLKYTCLSNANVHAFIYIKCTSVTHTRLSLYPHETSYQRTVGEVPAYHARSTGFSPRHHMKLDKMVHTCASSTGGDGGRGMKSSRSLSTSLGYRRHCLSPPPHPPKRGKNEKVGWRVKDRRYYPS